MDYYISLKCLGTCWKSRKLFKVGDKITTFIKEINENKIALSLKFDNTNPWLNASEKYAAGAIVTGTVARMTDFGAFVELETGVDALLHVSQIAREHIEKPADALKVDRKLKLRLLISMKKARKSA